MRRRHRGRWKHLKGNPQHHELSQYEERTSQCERQSFSVKTTNLSVNTADLSVKGTNLSANIETLNLKKTSVKLEAFSAERFGLKKDVRCGWSKMQLIQSPKNMFGQLPFSSISQPHKWIAQVNIILLREENPPSRGEPG